MSNSQHVLPSVGQLTVFAAERRSSVQDMARANAHQDLRDTFNARLLKGLTLVGPYDIPRIEASQQVPGSLIAFSEAMASTPDGRAWVHFYEDEYRFRRLWNKPQAYLHRLSTFAGVISPDFSVYRNLPAAQKIEHTYRNQLLGAWLQAQGVKVIANVRVSGRSSVPYALAGVPCQSSIALGLHGCTKDKANRVFVLEEIRLICDLVQPTNLLVYGSDAYGVLDYPRETGIPVHMYGPDSYRRAARRKGAA